MHLVDAFIQNDLYCIQMLFQWTKMLFMVLILISNHFREQYTHIVVQILTSMKKTAHNTSSMAMLGFRPNTFNKAILRGMTAEETHTSAFNIQLSGVCETGVSERSKVTHVPPRPNSWWGGSGNQPCWRGCSNTAPPPVCVWSGALGRHLSHIEGSSPVTQSCSGRSRNRWRKPQTCR